MVFFFFFFKYFICLKIFYYFWQLWVFCRCVWAFSSCDGQGLLFIVVCKLLIAVACVVVELGL